MRWGPASPGQRPSAPTKDRDNPAWGPHRGPPLQAWPLPFPFFFPNPSLLHSLFSSFFIVKLLHSFFLCAYDAV